MDPLETERPSRSIAKTFTSLFIIMIGMIAHLLRFSILELQQTRAEELAPNSASVLFTFSMLCIFSMLRPFWPRTMARPPSIVLFCVDLAAMLFSGEFLLRYLWKPVTDLLEIICQFVGGFFECDWLPEEGYYAARASLAFLIFVAMIDIIGSSHFHKAQPRPVSSGIFAETVNNTAEFEEEYERRREPDNFPIRFPNSAAFRLADLPYPPQQNLLFGRRQPNIVAAEERDDGALNDDSL